MWWLTDVKRKAEDENKPDEDGPPSSESDAQEGVDKQKAADALTEDSDPIRQGVIRSRCRRGA